MVWEIWSILVTSIAMVVLGRFSSRSNGGAGLLGIYSPNEESVPLLERCDGLGNMVNSCHKHRNGRSWALLFSFQWQNKLDLTWCSSNTIKRNSGCGSCVLHTSDFSKLVGLDTN
jgi:hypothetical protein